MLKFLHFSHPYSLSLPLLLMLFVQTISPYLIVTVILPSSIVYYQPHLFRLMFRVMIIFGFPHKGFTIVVLFDISNSVSIGFVFHVYIYSLIYYLFQDLFLKGILFPREYFFVQEANMFNVSIQICRNFSKPYNLY